jgi:mycothiol maleylpyruvate isomerase-like protein
MGNDDRFFAELRACTAELTRIVDGDLERPVPACPGWTLKQLASHVARGHRWAAQIVATLASAPVSTRDIPNGRMPDDPAQHEAWLTESADLVAEAVAAGRDVDLAPGFAPDGVDQWLGLVVASTAIPHQARELGGNGQTLHFHATDPDLDGTGSGWSPGRRPASRWSRATPRPTWRSAPRRPARCSR